MNNSSSSISHRLRQRAGSFVAESFFRGIAWAGQLHPNARPHKQGVEVERDVPYADGGSRDHQLDIYRPTTSAGPWPIVFYVHGGGFRILSKDTHWLMGLAFARRGYLVVSINYRLAPRHPYPAAIADTCAAYVWLTQNAARLGGDLSRLVVAGESAGANLVTALTLAACYPRPEPYARAVFETGVVPHAALPACGIFQVSDVARFRRRRKLPDFLFDRLHEVEHAYLGSAEPHPEGRVDLADPLLVLERGEPPARPLPPFFLPVGTGDILLDDTRRLKAALDALGVRCEARYYPGERHAFHAFVMREAARRCWRDSYAFLDEVMPAAQR